jgi:hypothetical protein
VITDPGTDLVTDLVAHRITDPDTDLHAAPSATVVG